MNSSLVSACVTLLRELKEAYGDGEAIKFWNKLGETLPDDIHGNVLLHLLQDDFEDDITHLNVYQIRKESGASLPQQKIQMIKTIRQFDSRQLTLKESKDVVEAFLDSKTVPLALKVRRSRKREFHEALVNLGCVGIS